MRTISLKCQGKRVLVLVEDSELADRGEGDDRAEPETALLFAYFVADGVGNVEKFVTLSESLTYDLFREIYEVLVNAFPFVGNDELGLIESHR